MAKRKRIALFLDLTDHIERLYFEGIERLAAQVGPWEYDTPRGTLGHPVPDLRMWRGDGVLGFLRTREIGRQIGQAKLPVVNMSNLDPGCDVPAVRRDYVAAGVLGAEYFLHRGLKNHALYSSTTSDIEVTRVLERAYAERLAEEGHACSVLYQRSTGDPTKELERDRQELLEWLKSLPKPLGLLATADLRAARILIACRDLGLNVPEEVSVLGMGNDELVCRFTRPTLSSISEDYSEVGYQAAALLHRLMEGAKPPDAPVLIAPGPIVDRQSTDVTVAGDAYIQKALRYIAQHACDPITVADVVRRLPIHRTRFECLFRRALHRPPYSEITRVRMDRARKLLAESTRSVAEVAATCGFANYSSFSVAFKRETGTSPRTYRRQSRSPRLGRPLR